MRSAIRRRAIPMATLIGAALATICSAQPARAPAVQAADAQTGAARSGDAQAQQASLRAADHALQWPRTLDAPNGMHVQLYQPQIDSWNGDQIGGRMADGGRRGQRQSDIWRGAVCRARRCQRTPAGLVYVDRIRIQKIDLPRRRKMPRNCAACWNRTSRPA